MQKHRIYLAGPIFGRSKSDVRSWREEAAARLTFLGAEPLDPCRRDYTGIEHVDDNPAKIVAEDLAEIDGCSAIIAMVDAPSAGTSMEIFYAAHVRKIPVIAMVPDSVAVSPWVSHHAEVIKWSADDLGMGRSLDGRAARSAAIGHACARALSAISDDALRSKLAELERCISKQREEIEALEEMCAMLRNDVVDEQKRRSDEARDFSKKITSLQALAEQRAGKIDDLEIVVTTQSATIKELRESCERRRGEQALARELGGEEHIPLAIEIYSPSPPSPPSPPTRSPEVVDDAADGWLGGVAAARGGRLRDVLGCHL